MESKDGYQEGKSGDVDGSIHSPGVRGRGRERKSTDDKEYDCCAEEKGSKDCSEERVEPDDDSSDAEASGLLHPPAYRGTHDLEIVWNNCYSSMMRKAAKTASSCRGQTYWN